MIATIKNNQKQEINFLTTNSIYNFLCYLRQITLIIPRAIDTTIIKAIVIRKTANCGAKEATIMTTKAKDASSTDHDYFI